MKRQTGLSSSPVQTHLEDRHSNGGMAYRATAGMNDAPSCEQLELERAGETEKFKGE